MCIWLTKCKGNKNKMHWNHHENWLLDFWIFLTFRARSIDHYILVQNHITPYFMCLRFSTLLCSCFFIKTWYHLLKVGIWIASATATLFYVFSTKSVSFLHTSPGHFHLSGFKSTQEENGAIQTDMALNKKRRLKNCRQFPVYQN